MDIEIKPIVTEKATRLTDKLNRYTFRVSPEANKYQIKDLVEKLYGVKVAAVNTAVMRAKNKSRWTKAACCAVRHRAGRKPSSPSLKARPSTFTATSDK